MTGLQRQVLEELRKWEDAPSYRELTDNLDKPAYRSERWSKDKVRSHLRALERRGWVARVGVAPVRVQLTPAGSAALELHGGPTPSVVLP